MKDRAFLDTFKNKRCLICGRYGADPDHIKTRGSGGGDEWWNVSALCRRHHTERHQIGIISMMKKYPAYALDLKSKGWEVNEMGKIVRAELP